MNACDFEELKQLAFEQVRQLPLDTWTTTNSFSAYFLYYSNGPFQIQVNLDGTFTYIGLSVQGQELATYTGPDNKGKEHAWLQDLADKLKNVVACKKLAEAIGIKLDPIEKGPELSDIGPPPISEPPKKRKWWRR